VNKSPVQFQSVQGNHQAWFAYLGLTHWQCLKIVTVDDFYQQQNHE
jgi:hypothetical protein